MRLVVKDVQRYMEAKSVSKNCPCCGNEYSFISGFGPNESTTALTFTSHPEDLGGYSSILHGGFARPVISVECMNCAHIRLFSYHAVFYWAMQNQVPTLQSPAGFPNV